MNKTLISWIILISLSLVWGSSFILMKMGMRSFSSTEVAALRISIAFVVLFPFMIWHYRKLPFKKYWKGIFITGVFGNLVPAFLFTEAETQISSSLTGMLNALTPLFTVLTGLLVFKNGIKTRQWIGIFIGLLGTIGLLAFGESGESSKNLNYALLVVAATFCYAVSVNGIKYYLSDVHPLTTTVWAFTMVGPVSLIYLFTKTDFTTHLHSELGISSFAYVCVLAIVGTALAVILFNQLIKNSGTVFASSCTYLIPIVAIGWGLLYGEKISGIQVISMGVIIGGLWLLNKK